MKDKMKGFTLVELLAVIIILAIVALVTTPAILNVINNSRMEGAKDKAWGTIDAVKLAFTQSQTLDNDVTLDSDVTVDFSKAVSEQKVGTRAITMSGERPTSGTVTIDVDTGEINCTDLKFTKNGKYKCSSTGGTEMVCTKS